MEIESGSDRISHKYGLNRFRVCNLMNAGMTTYAWNGPFPLRQFWGSHLATGPQYISWGRQGDINVWDPEYLTQPLQTYTLPGMARLRPLSWLPAHAQGRLAATRGSCCNRCTWRPRPSSPSAPPTAPPIGYAIA